MSTNSERSEQVCDLVRQIDQLRANHEVRVAIQGNQVLGSTRPVAIALFDHLVAIEESGRSIKPGDRIKVSYRQLGEAAGQSEDTVGRRLRMLSDAGHIGRELQTNVISDSRFPARFLRTAIVVLPASATSARAFGMYLATRPTCGPKHGGLRSPVEAWQEACS